MRVDLNADLGKRFGSFTIGDEAMLEIVTSTNTACEFHGGYPKIATVIFADLPETRHATPHCRFTLQAVNLATAYKLRSEQEAELALVLSNIRPV